MSRAPVPFEATLEERIAALESQLAVIGRELGHLFKLLAHRDLVLDEPLRARVLACTDESQLERWFDRALAATTLADVFADP